MNANETCEDSIHGPYEPDDVADHCGGCGIPLCEEHARKCPLLRARQLHGLRRDM
ncbi:hypothetical protein MCC01979_18280 [Bifidobacteriaceae bacterium MCC01979]|nr:hypothetical protein MCC01983_06440 [Bifidobacteriaceae bacterium MCC01983]GDZ54978.1 hypothetical protein MCC01979_18280 [Bifidobacteriaceae bacterium MCC01979]